MVISSLIFHSYFGLRLNSRIRLLILFKTFWANIIHTKLVEHRLSTKMHFQKFSKKIKKSFQSQTSEALIFCIPSFVTYIVTNIFFHWLESNLIMLIWNKNKKKSRWQKEIVSVFEWDKDDFFSTFFFAQKHFFFKVVRIRNWVCVGL